MRTALYGILAAGLSVAACGGTSPTQPSSTPTLAVKALKVDGAGMAVTETQQFSATADMADGSSQDVTSRAKWTSSDPTVASVSATGVVTGLKPGSTDIHATFQDKTALKNTSIRALKISTLAGVVDDAAPNVRPLVGVLVQVLDGPNKGLSAATDGNGYYSLDLHEDTFTVSFSLDGYIAVTKSLGLTDAPRRLDVVMFPTPPAGATARCKNKSWSFALDKPSSCTRAGGVAYYVCPGPLCTS